MGIFCRTATMSLFTMVATFFAIAPSTGLAAGPSFDCGKAALPDEKAICADAQLAAIDLSINEAYRTFEPYYEGDKKQMARALAAERRDCEAEAACIASVQINALETFGRVEAWMRSYGEGLIGKKALDTAARAPGWPDEALPVSVGQCGLTHIDELTTRFQESLKDADPAEGSGATFTNGGRVVSYERQPALVASEVGNAVAICLISIPRDCPDGDERGRVYYGINLSRDHSPWTLPDSQHACGGA